MHDPIESRRSCVLDAETRGGRHWQRNFLWPGLAEIVPIRNPPVLTPPAGVYCRYSGNRVAFRFSGFAPQMTLMMSTQRSGSRVHAAEKMSALVWSPGRIWPKPRAVKICAMKHQGRASPAKE